MSELQCTDNPTLEKLIREVDYVKMGENYIPSKFAIKFINFIKLVNGEDGEENKSPLFHYDILDTVYKNKNVLIISFRGSSKALALDTLLMTPTGHVSMGDVEIGDYVLDRNGKPTKVTHTSEVFHNQTYTITLSNGESFVANEDHTHILQYMENGEWKEVNLTTKEMLKDSREFFIPLVGRTLPRAFVEAVEPTKKSIPSRCISVESGTCSYLLRGGIVTHNTTLVAEYMILYQAVFGELDGFGKVTVGMYVGDTMENGVKNLRANLEHRYNNSEFLQKFIVHARFTDVEWEFTNAEGHKLCYRGFGASTGVRGFKKYGERPQFAILDDLMSDKSAESKTIIKDIENVIYKAVRQAMHPTKRKVIWIGTPFNKKDPLYKAAGTKAWSTKVYPICMQFPCTKENFVGAWEDRFPYEAVRAEYDMLKENGRVDAFNQELMLRILSDDDRLVLDEDIVWYTRNTVLNNLQDYNIYITTDFATSEKEKADFSVISVWALDWKGRFHWIDGIVKRQDMAVNVDDVFRLVQLYVPLLTGVEISGQQKGFVSWLKREMTVRSIYFMIASDKSSGEEGLRPNTSKLTRFNVALPLFKQRKIAFPEELKESAAILEFIDELSSVTPSGFKSLHDDCADTISQLPLIEYFTPIDPKFKRVEERSMGSENNYYFTEPKEEYKSSYIV